MLSFSTFIVSPGRCNVAYNALDAQSSKGHSHRRLSHYMQPDPPHLDKQPLIQFHRCTSGVPVKYRTIPCKVICGCPLAVFSAAHEALNADHVQRSIHRNPARESQPRSLTVKSPCARSKFKRSTSYPPSEISGTPCTPIFIALSTAHDIRFTRCQVSGKGRMVHMIPR